MASKIKQNDPSAVLRRWMALLGEMTERERAHGAFPGIPVFPRACMMRHE